MTTLIDSAIARPSFTHQVLAYVQYLLMIWPDAIREMSAHRRLRKIEAYLIRRYNR